MSLRWIFPPLLPVFLVGFCLLAQVGPAGSEPEAGAASVLSGRVLGLAEEVEAVVQLRRLGAASSPDAKDWDQPRQGGADSRYLERWLGRGRASGAPVAQQTLRGAAASFRFGGLPRGLYELRVVPSRGQTTTAVASISSLGQHVELDLTLPAGALTLRARLLTPSGEPFRGFVVVSQRERGVIAFPFLRGAVELETDASGLVVIPGLHPGACELAALIPGQLRVGGHSFQLPYLGTYEWTVQPGPVLTGQVVVGDEEPETIVGASVFVLAGGTSEGAFTLARVASDEHGAFRLPAGSGEAELLIAKPGFAPVWLEREGETDLGTIRLDRTATVLGWVRGPEGRALADVPVHARPDDCGRAGLSMLSTRTDSTGHYALQGVAPGEVRVFVRGERWVSLGLVGEERSSYDALALELRPGETRRLDLRVVAARVQVTAPGFKPVSSGIMIGPDARPELVLESNDDEVMRPAGPLLTIRGRIAAPKGVERATFRLRRSAADEELLGRWANEGGTRETVRPDGTFEISVPGPGRYGLRAQMQVGGQGYFAQLYVQGGADNVEIRLRPVSWTRPIWTFRIVDPEGRPVPRGTALGTVRGRSGVHGIRRTFRAGRLEVEGEPGAREADWVFYDAADRSGRGLPLGPAFALQVAPADAPRQVVLPREDIVWGVVVGPDGNGVRAVRVEARPLGLEGGLGWSHERSTLTNGAGWFRLGGLGSGPYALRLEVPERMAQVRSFLVEAGAVRYRDVVIRLHHAVAPRFQVLGPDGEPLSGAKLRIEQALEDSDTFDDNTEFEEGFFGSADVLERTNDVGQAGFRRLDPERGYVLWVEPPETRADLAPLYQPAWLPRARQEIRLMPWATLRGRVRDAAGAPVEGVQVWVRQPGDFEFRACAKSAADGSFALDHLRPGSLTLLASELDAEPTRDSSLGLLHTVTSTGEVILIRAR